MIGAGGYTFPLRLVRDLLAFESAQDATFALTDIDPVGLERTRRLTERLIDGHGLTTRVAASLDRRAMLRDADVVLVTFQVGGLEAYRHDVELPRRYGIRTVGLCHSVQGTSRTLARILGIEDRHWTFRCAGINHQAWFTHFACDGVDATAELLDPLTAAVLPLERIHAMVEELLAAEAAWLPQL